MANLIRGVDPVNPELDPSMVRTPASMVENLADIEDPAARLLEYHRRKHLAEQEARDRADGEVPHDDSPTVQLVGREGQQIHVTPAAVETLVSDGQGVVTATLTSGREDRLVGTLLDITRALGRPAVLDPDANTEQRIAYGLQQNAIRREREALHAAKAAKAAATGNGSGAA